jgi:hypothetical protein
LLTRLIGRVRGEEPPNYGLVRSASISGTIVDDTGASHAPYRLQFSVSTSDLMQRPQDQVDGLSWKLTWECETSADGRFEILDLPAEAWIDVKAFSGKKQVFWINGGFPTAPNLAPGESRTVGWHIGGGVPVEGMAYDEDLQPVPNHEIWLLRAVFDAAAHPGPYAVLRSDDMQGIVARARTDDRGRFSINGVSPGTWWAGIAPPPGSPNETEGIKPFPLAVQFEVRRDAPFVPITIRRLITERIGGTVLGPDGAPLGGAEILLSKEVPLSFGDVCGRSAANGTFEVIPLDGGKWWIGAQAPESELSFSEPIQVQGAQQGIVLRTIRAGAMSGEIVCPDCKRVQVLQIHFLGAEIGSMSDPQAFGAAHTFKFSNRRPGVYHIWAECEPDRVGWLRDIKLEPGAVVKDLRVELTQGAVLVVRYTGKDPRCNFTLLLDEMPADFMSVRRGRTVRLIVPAGAVKLRPDEGGVERVVTVRAGTETEVVLDDN